MASESKRQNGVDRISELPDAVLCQILSFLPTTYAMWTTVLSRRWNNLWTSLPNLDFDNKAFPTNNRAISSVQSFNRFMSAVESALSIHRFTDLGKFCFSISVEHFSVEDLSRISSLICSAIRHNVVEINLSLCAEDFRQDPFELPQSLFMCTTLEDLKVFSNFNVSAPPTTGSLPSLKVLHVSVLWSDENAPEAFFLNCPVLEDLTLAGRICFHDVEHIDISAPTLKRLTISLRCHNEWYDSWYTFSINAPNMEYFDVKEDALSNYSFKTTKSLVKAKVHFLDEIQYQDVIEFFDKDPGFAIRATALLAGISNVEYLSLDNQPHCLEACYVPALENLTKLKLVLRDCYHWELLTQLLMRSPKLQYLVFEHIHTNVDNKYPQDLSESRWNPPEFVPVCLLSCLETIRIRGFKGTHDEMEAAKYLLKNSDVLNEMAIYTGDLQCTKEELIEDYGVFQRGSKICKLVFI